MIEVTVWWSGSQGDGVSKFLVRLPTDRDGAGGTERYFAPADSITAIRRALVEHEKNIVAQDERNKFSSHGNLGGSVYRIEVRNVPDRVLEL